ELASAPVPAPLRAAAARAGGAEAGARRVASPSRGSLQLHGSGAAAVRGDPLSWWQGAERSGRHRRRPQRPGRADRRAGEAEGGRHLDECGERALPLRAVLLRGRFLAAVAGPGRRSYRRHLRARRREFAALSRRRRGPAGATAFRGGADRSHEAPPALFRESARRRDQPRRALSGAPQHSRSGADRRLYGRDLPHQGRQGSRRGGARDPRREARLRALRRDGSGALVAGVRPVRRADLAVPRLERERRLQASRL
ncbi:MAG: Putative transmembrane protein, partial [uncultured Sphingosinicella sp.]